MNALDKLVEDIGKATFQDVVTAEGSDLVNLLHTATPIFEQFDESTQTTAIALMLGMILGVVEGDTCPIEQQGILMDKAGRLRVFLAQVEVAYRESIEAATHPDCPKRPGSQVN